MRGDTIFLPTERCHEAALPADFTRDDQKMRQIDQFKVKTPEDRYDRIHKLINSLVNNEEFKKWMIQIETRMASVDAKMLYPPKVEDPRGGGGRSYYDYTGRKI